MKVINLFDKMTMMDMLTCVNLVGGFKTWECSLDLVEYLAKLPKDQISNKRVLEVSVFIL